MNDSGAPSEAFTVPQGSFNLDRHPPIGSGPLRAWDAADEYLLQNIAKHAPTADKRVLVVNDSFGALAMACATDAEQVTSWSDSSLAHIALTHNLERRLRDAEPVDAAPNTPEKDDQETEGAPPPGEITRRLNTIDLLASTEDPPEPDLVLIKVPKSLALLEDQLCRLSPLLNNGAVIIGAGMSKHVHTSTIDLFERIVGPTKTSRAQKKARLIFAERDVDVPTRTSRWPSTHDVELATGATLTVTNHASVFARDRLDAGTRLLLDNLPSGLEGASILDLGCGSGILGTAAGLANPGASVTFIDESYLAVASAEATATAALGVGAVSALVSDSLTSLDGDTEFDLIVNNPPFHQDHAIGDSVAWQMFNESYAALKPGGELRIVGNRNLGYHAKLSRIFGKSENVASTKKFVVINAIRL